MLAVALGALFLGIPHIQESAEAALAPKKQPPQDGPAGQDPGWLESPPHPPSPPPDPPSRPHGCDMQGVYCSKNETKAPDHGDGNGGEELKADEDHSEGGALKKLAKKVKAKAKMARAHKKIASAGSHKKKLKKKLKAHEKLAAAKARQHAAAAKKSDDGAVSFLQYEEATRDAAALQPHGLSLLLKKLASKSSDADDGDEGGDEEGEGDEDWCDPAVQEAFFNMVDADGGGSVDAQELTDAAVAHGMTADEGKAMFDLMDADSDGKVTLDEWKAAINTFEGCGNGGEELKKLVKKVKEDPDEDWCDPAVQEKYFNMVDDDESGSVDADELTVVAQAHGMTADEAKDMFDLMDENDDGEVTLDEWEAAINTCEECDEEAAHTTKLKAHDEGGALKKLAKKVKAKAKMARAHKKIASAGANKKKLKKKLKAHEKLAAAKARQHAAAAKKSDDGAVSFLQYEEATRDAAALQPHGLSLLLKKLASKSSDADDGDEGGDEEGEGDEDWCDPAVQEAFFNMVDADGGGSVDAQELTDAAVAHGMTADEGKAMFDLMDADSDGKVTLDEWKAAINTFEGCDEESAHTTKLKAHTEGGGKKKLKKKLKAMEKKAEARRKQGLNSHAKKVIKKKIKAAEKMAEAKERAHAAAAKKAAEQDGDDGKDVKAR